MIRDETISRRLTLLGVVLIGISLVLLARLLSFQFRMNPEIKQALEDQAKNRYQQTVEVLPKRGQIFDRNGHLLATNSFEYRIGISPNQVIDRQAVAIALAPLLGLPENRLYDLLQPNADGTFPPYVLLASRVSAEVGQDCTQEPQETHSDAMKSVPPALIRAHLVSWDHASRSVAAANLVRVPPAHFPRIRAATTK